jgi:2',3'-cyclic-nucleotide 2'-phosphodiesterase (5'-nucleotidase family)
MKGRNIKWWILPLTLTIYLMLVTVWTVGATDEVTITFYHTSDIHENSANLARIAQFVHDQKSKNPNVLFLDTGDWFQLGDLRNLNTRGEAIVDLMSACKYDAVILGNRDYSFGTKRLVELVDTYSLPLLTANCIWPENMKPNTIAPYRIFSYNGVTVAVIGTASTIVWRQTDAFLNVLPIEDSVKKILDDIDSSADIIVLMTHIGVGGDRRLAKEFPRVDIIFGGHDHIALKKLTFDKENQTLIQHSGSFGQHIGEVIITWDGKNIVDRNVRLIDVTQEMPESPKVKEVLHKYVPPHSENNSVGSTK